MSTPEFGEHPSNTERFTQLIDAHFVQAGQTEEHKPRRHAPGEGFREEEVFLATEGAEFFIGYPPESIRAVRPKEGDTTKLKRKPLGHQLHIIQYPTKETILTTDIYIKEGQLYQEQRKIRRGSNRVVTPTLDAETGLTQLLAISQSIVEDSSGGPLEPEESTLILQLLRAVVPIAPPAGYLRD